MEQAIIERASEDLRSQTPCTLASLTEFIHDSFGVQVSVDLVRHTVKRSALVKTATAIPMEQERVDCATEDIDEHFRLLAAEVTDIPACLVCNLDEMGWGEFQDAQPITIVVPSDQPDEVPLPVERARKRVTILHCIFADGSFVRPLVITSRKTVDQEVFDAGYTPDKTRMNPKRCSKVRHFQTKPLPDIQTGGEYMDRSTPQRHPIEPLSELPQLSFPTAPSRAEDQTPYRFWPSERYRLMTDGRLA